MAANIRQLESETVSLSGLEPGLVNSYVRAVFDTGRLTGKNTLPDEALASRWNDNPDSHLDTKKLTPAAQSIARMLLQSGEIPNALPPQDPDALKKAVESVAKRGLNAGVNAHEIVVHLLGRSTQPGLRGTARTVRTMERAKLMHDSVPTK